MAQKIKKPSFSIRSFIACNGERISQLYNNDEGGFPMFYPTAFIARYVRLRSSYETQKVYLEAIKRLCEWEAKRNIDLTQRFMRLDFLKPYEIDELAKCLRETRHGKPGETISPSKGNTYIAYTAKYLRWLVDEVVTDANTYDIRTAIDTQEKVLIRNTIYKSGSASANAQHILNKRLSDKTRERLLALFDAPFVDLYRDADKGARFRNVVMLRILYETGMRRGELLSLKLQNFLECAGGSNASLVIKRNHNDEFDIRVNQPVAKTYGRTVPISNELENQLLEYISSYRSEVIGAGFTDEDFIFVNHRAGRGQGAPMSISTFGQVLQNIRLIFPELGALHPHLLRHDWNYRFSKLADAQGLKPEKERELREILMGWTSGSGMAQLYNLRHTQEQSAAIGLMVAKATQKPIEVPRLVSNTKRKAKFNGE